MPQIAGTVTFLRWSFATMGGRSVSLITTFIADHGILAAWHCSIREIPARRIAS